MEYEFFTYALNVFVWFFFIIFTSVIPFAALSVNVLGFTDNYNAINPAFNGTFR